MKRFLRRLLGFEDDSYDSRLESAAITPRDTAIAVARREAENRKHAWREPAAAHLYLKENRWHWWVEAPATGIGYKVRVSIDDASGEVVDFHVLPR